MQSTKPWYLSAGVWGALFSVLASALALFKVRHDPALLRDVTDWLLQLSTLPGGAVALYGRVRASRRITLVPHADAAGEATADGPGADSETNPGTNPESAAAAKQ